MRTPLLNVSGVLPAPISIADTTDVVKPEVEGAVKVVVAVGSVSVPFHVEEPVIVVPAGMSNVAAAPEVVDASVALTVVAESEPSRLATVEK